MKNPIALLGKVATVLLALFFLVVPINSFLGKGPFDWHIEQAEAWQGGSEVLGLCVLFFGSLSLPWKRARIALVLLFGWLYARRHGVDLSIMAWYLCAEAMLALGWSLLPRIGMTRIPRHSNLLIAGLVGVVVWSLVIWTSSAAGLGAAPAVTLIAVAVLGMALVLGRGPRLGAVLLRSMHRKSVLERLFCALIASFFLALFAKASVVVDSDSLWYGLQAEKFLVGDGGLYSGQGLVAVVHYYPKLYEALQLPFAGLGSVSLIYGSGIFSALLVALTCAAILREYRVRPEFRCAGMAIVMTMPALANIAVTAKGDAFSSWLLLLGVLALVRFRKGLSGAWLWISVTSLALAILARLSNLPYAALLFVLLVASAVQRSLAVGNVAWLANRGAWLAMAGALLSAMVLARTYLLAGVFLVAPVSVVELQGALGLTLKYPVGSLPVSDQLPRFPVIAGLRSVLFDPASLPHIIIGWTGNVWAFLPLAALLLWPRQGQPKLGAWPMLVLGLSYFVVLFGYRFLVPGGDGNYFIVPIVCLTIWGVVQSRRLTDSSGRLLAMVLFFFALVSAAISFVTGSWGPGTRALDVVSTRLPFELDRAHSPNIAAAKLGDVDKFFNGMPPSTRVLGVEAAGLSPDATTGFWLPVRYEPAEVIGWSRPELWRDSNTVVALLAQTQIEYVVMPVQSTGKWVEIQLKAALSFLHGRGQAKRVHQDGTYEIWQLARASVARAELEGGGYATVEISPELLCQGHGVATVEWSAASPVVAIEVEGEGGDAPSLWAEAGRAGRLDTGPWVAPYTRFIFKRGRQGEVLGSVELNPNCH
ncbi:hypothetical protein MNR01_14245 [Lysobacter sp. S4-A87]|uniref:hypothetical protein n=1 Tax=Lysobacter sp. S4-A87 TaxID=2925843 RepID=UPI001F53DD93|nr:hypothetical protein [Lysobacter sp. S4-A87]UNK48886.1 hypothetical protein MNR01_14245 [Lysobacter sp. S4-A87]